MGKSKRNQTESPEIAIEEFSSNTISQHELLGNSASQELLKNRKPFVAADYFFDELEGENDTEKFHKLTELEGAIVYIPPGTYEVEGPFVFESRAFLFGLENDKPKIDIKTPKGTKGVTGLTFKGGARIKNIDFKGSKGIDTLIQFGETGNDTENRNEDDVDGSISGSNFENFKTAVRYNGRNCKMNDNVFDSGRKKSTDVHLSYSNIEVDLDGGRGTLPHYSHRKNSFRGNKFSSGQKNTGIQLSGEVPIRGLVVSENKKEQGGSLLSVEGSGGVRDSIINNNNVSGIGKGGDPTIHFKDSEARGLVMHNNQFSGLKRDSELFKSSSSLIDGRGVFKTTSEKAEDDTHGMSITNGELKYQDSLTPGKSEKLQKQIGETQVLNEDIAWAENQLVDSISNKNANSSDNIFDGSKEPDYIVGKKKNKTITEQFKEIAENSNISVVHIEAGIHNVTESIVFKHKVHFIGPKSAGGTKSGRPKVFFDFSAIIEQYDWNSKNLTGFTFEAGADIENVTFKGGKDKGDQKTTVNLLQFGTKDGDNQDVSANIRNCNLGEFKGKRAITNYGTKSHIEKNSFSDAPGAGTTAIELRPTKNASKKDQNNIYNNTFHLGGSHTSLRTSGDVATENLLLKNNVSDIGGRLLDVQTGLKNAQINTNTVSGGHNTNQHSAILDFQRGVLKDIDVLGNSFAGLDLDTGFAAWSEDKLDNSYSDNPYEDSDRSMNVVRVTEDSKIQKNGLNLFGNNLSFAREGNDAISIEGKKNKKNVSVKSNIIRNSDDQKEGNDGISAGVTNIENNVGSGRKK